MAVQDEVIGQERIWKHLGEAIHRGHLSHAYILEGEEGLGGQALAQRAARLLQCQSPTEREGLAAPCEQCSSCLRASSGSHPDIQVLTHQKRDGSDKSTTLGVGDARRLVADICVRPYEGPYKIYIVPRADEMTPQAQNALIKTLEEPPDYAVIFLLARESALLLPTILSRCVLLRLQPVEETKILTMLLSLPGKEGEGTYEKEERAGVCARLSHGSPGRARELFESADYTVFLEKVLGLLTDLPRRDAHEIAVFANETAEAGRTGELMEVTDGFLTDVMKAKSVGDADHLLFQAQVQYSNSIAKAVGYTALGKAQEVVQEAIASRRAGGNDARILELMLLQIRACLRTNSAGENQK